MILDDDTLRKYVSLRGDGTLVVESVLEKLMETDTARLLACVEDNIIETSEGEQIDYMAALKDFYEGSNDEGTDAAVAAYFLIVQNTTIIMQNRGEQYDP
jgi:hypothetical protein